MIELFLKTFIFYFIVIDPIGSTPLFLVVTEHLDVKEKIKVLRNISVIVIYYSSVTGTRFLKAEYKVPSSNCSISPPTGKP